MRAFRPSSLPSTVLLAALLVLGGTAVRLPAASAPAPAWTAPTGRTLADLERALAAAHANYNPAEQMTRRPFSSPGYHTALTGGMVHPTRDSIGYAVGLLDTGKPEHLERAVAIVRRIVALQDTDPASRTYGIWSWFLEEPLPKMSPPDWNWADFIGTQLLQIARDHRARLPADLAAQVDAAIRHACAAIKKRNVGPGYTNIAIMGAYVTLFGGELLDLPEFRDYGRDRLRRFHAYTVENGSFEEYNSPTYTIVALHELSRLAAHVRDAESRPLIDELVRRAWTEIATHFHAPTRQWAGPHSRAYRSLLNDSTFAQIQRGTAGRVAFGVPENDRESIRLPLACPPDLEPLFTSLPAPRTVTQTFIKRTGTVGTTYLHPHYALGSVNHGDLWNQRRALIAYFGPAAQPGYLHLRFLKNNYDFSSALLHSAQREGLVVGAVDFLTNGGDTHISLQRVKDATITARDLRLRFELGGSGRTAAVRLTGENTATIAAGDLTFHVTLARARFGDLTGTFSTGHERDLRFLDVVLHAGAERTFKLTELQEAILAFVLSVGPHPAPSVATANGQLTLAVDGLSATARLAPYKR